MNSDIQATRKLLTELREAYRSLPRHFRADVTHVLSALAQEQAAPIIRRRKGECDDEVCHGVRSIQLSMQHRQR